MKSITPCIDINDDEIELKHITIRYGKLKKTEEIYSLKVIPF